MFFFYLPSRRSEIEKRGVREHGSLELKDSQPLDDGRMAYTATFTFPDSKNVNHRVTNQIDGGMYDSLKTGQDVIIHYLPNDPDRAAIDGAQAILLQDETGQSKGAIPLAAPYSSALRFLAWSLLIGSFPVYYWAYVTGKRPRAKKPKGPVMARR